MKNRFSAEINVAFDNLLNDALCLRFLYFFLLVEQLHEVAMGTILGDYVVEVFCLICIVKSNNIGVA